MEHWSDSMLQEQVQPPPPNKGIPFLPGNSVSALVCFAIAHTVLLALIRNSWMIGCCIWLYLISVLLLVCNGKAHDLSVNHTVEVRKWRRLCTILLCLLVMVFPASIYYAVMEYWLKVSMVVGSGILLVLIAVFHVALVELSEVKENIVTQPKHTGSIMYYNILNMIPFCATFAFVLIPFGDSWSLWCSALLCADMLIIVACMSKASQLKSVPNRQAEAMKWMRAVSFGMAMIPALVLMYLDGLLWDSFVRMVSRIWLGFLVLLVVLFHLFYVEMAKVKSETDGGDSEKRN